MWFKALQVFHITQNTVYDLADIEKRLEMWQFEPCNKTTQKTFGWSAPTGKQGHLLYHVANGYVLLALKFQEKLIPQQVIREEMELRLEKLKQTQEVISKREKMQIKEDVIQNLMMSAFHKSRTTYAYIDMKKHRLVIDAASPARADEFLALFTRTFDFKLKRPEIQSTVSMLTEWLAAGSASKPFYIEDACLLESADEDASLVKFKGQENLSEYTQDYLEEQYFVKQLLLSWSDRLMFNIQDGLRVSRLGFLSIVKDAVKEIDAEGELAKFDADFFIMTETLDEFFDDLLGAFGDQIYLGDKKAAHKKTSQKVVTEA